MHAPSSSGALGGLPASPISLDPVWSYHSYICWQKDRGVAGIAACCSALHSCRLRGGAAGGGEFTGVHQQRR